VHPWHDLNDDSAQDRADIAARDAAGTARAALYPDDVTSPMRSLVIKSTSGADRLEACNQALTVAATAVAAGAEVSLWLTGEASWLAIPGRAEELVLEHAAPLADLLRAVLAGGTVTVCTQCAMRRGITADDLLPGVRIAGAAVFVEESLAPLAQALVY
jgi:predicted peroxiredoxin